MRLTCLYGRTAFSLYGLRADIVSYWQHAWIFLLMILSPLFAYIWRNWISVMVNGNKRMCLSRAQHLKTPFFNGVQRVLFLLASCCRFLNDEKLEIGNGGVMLQHHWKWRCLYSVCLRVGYSAYSAYDFMSSAMGQALVWERESLVKYKFPTTGIGHGWTQRRENAIMW